MRRLFAGRLVRLFLISACVGLGVCLVAGGVDLSGGVRSSRAGWGFGLRLDAVAIGAGAFFLAFASLARREWLAP